MAAHTKVGLRYAQALYGLAEEKGLTASVAAEMEQFARIFELSEDFRIMLKSPVIRFDKKVAAIQAVFGNKLSELTLLFIQKLTKSRREMYLGDVAQSFVHLYNKKQGVLEARIVTAAPLSEENRKRIREIVLSDPQFKGTTSVVLQEEVQPDLIGGYVLTVGDRQIDSSFSGKLKSLKRNFSQNLYIKDF
jgi:F-type H+-transporting ATPase subunit delta